jgi:hypothetical protein
MLKWLMRRRLDAYERKLGLDMGYMHEILETDIGALLAMGKTMAMTHYRRDVPAEPWYAAAITATVHSDCGPCTQIAVARALDDGVSAAAVRAVLSGDEARMGGDVVLAVRFARAVLRHDGDADGLRAEVRRRWGPRALLPLTFAVAGGQLYPTIKYGLGYAAACTRVTVDGAPVAVARAA